MGSAVMTSDILANSTSFFLQLPPELRDDIYAVLLTGKPVHSSILHVSRLVHTEALPHLYSKNIFTAHPRLLTSLPCLLFPSRPVTSPSLIAMIRRYCIRIRLDVDAPWTAEAVTKAFSGVEELVIEVWQASFGTCGVGVLEPFAGVRRVGKASIGGSVGGGFARWLEGVMMGSAEEVEWEGSRWDGWERG